MKVVLQQVARGHFHLFSIVRLVIQSQYAVLPELRPTSLPGTPLVTLRTILSCSSGAFTMTSPPSSLAGCDSAAAFLNAVQRDSHAIFAYHQATIQANDEMSAAGLSLQATVSNQAAKIEALTNEVSDLRDRCNKVQGANEMIVSMWDSRQTSLRLSPKHPDPDMFSGKRSDLTRFTTQMKVKLHQNKDHFTAPNSDLFYSISRLEGDAMAQVQPFIKSESEIELKSMTELFNLLQLAFGDPDKKGTAQRAIRSLRQTNREFHEYLAEFQRYIPDTNYDDEAKLAALIEGLSVELKSMLQYVPTPTSLMEAIKILQELENKRKMFGAPANRTSQRSALTPANLASGSFLNHTRASSSAPSSMYTPTGSSISPQSSTSNVSHSDHMDLSTSRPRGPLSVSEKDRRITEGLCLYCGEAGHIARNCPQSHKRQSRLSNMTMATEPKASQESENL